MKSKTHPAGTNAEANASEAWQAAAAYHNRTKHHFDRYAASLGYLDWNTQPDPFRRYEGAELIQLLLTAEESRVSYDQLYIPRAVQSQSVNRESISALFEWSLAISAWKQFKESRWALRINPSSGNLHPTEGYLVIGPEAGLHDRAGVFHYAPRAHLLEKRAEFDGDNWRQLLSGLPAGTFLVGLTSIHWREAWKYGERAFRYCQHDVGHALAAISLSAAIQGWTCVALPGVTDQEIEILLGLGRDEDFPGAEREEPDLLLAIVPAGEFAENQPDRVDSDALRSIGARKWAGKANRLSASHPDWPVIDEVALACRKPKPLGRVRMDAAFALVAPLAESRKQQSASKIIRQRRSAVAFDGKTAISASQFYLMLDRVLPRYDRAPWSALAPPTCIHLAIFVHRVDSLEPGLYFLVREPGRLSEIRGLLNPGFAWEKPLDCPDSLPLFILASGDTRTISTNISCHQDIAGDSAFSLGMIAEFADPLKAFGAWFYRRLFWETGVIGQVLYLEAEAAGARATGIGCYFDDPMHSLLGIQSTKLQSLYHFTVGGPVEDTRLTTLPAYSPNVSSR